MSFNRCRILYLDSMFLLVGEHRHHLRISPSIGHVRSISKMRHSISEDTMQENTIKSSQNWTMNGVLSIKHSSRSTRNETIDDEHLPFRFQPIISLRIFLGTVQILINSLMSQQNTDFPIFRTSLVLSIYKYRIQMGHTPRFRTMLHTSQELSGPCVVVSNSISENSPNDETDSLVLQK